MRRFALIALAALLIFGSAATPVSAGKGWCRSDPIVTLNGVELQFWVAIPDDVQDDVLGPINITMFAHLLQRLRDTEEGAGNLLDSSCILLGSDCAQGFGHSTFDQPLLVAGRGGGDLVHPGIHYRSPTKENTSDVLLTCLQTVVPTAMEVGADEGYSNTACTAIKV